MTSIPSPANCEGIEKYVTDNGLKNERRLTQSEVVEHFRILEQNGTVISLILVSFTVAK
jgi:hypothetical protein